MLGIPRGSGTSRGTPHGLRGNIQVMRYTILILVLACGGTGGGPETGTLTGMSGVGGIQGIGMTGGPAGNVGAGGAAGVPGMIGAGGIASQTGTGGNQAQGGSGGIKTQGGAAGGLGGSAGAGGNGGTTAPSCPLSGLCLYDGTCAWSCWDKERVCLDDRTTAAKLFEPCGYVVTRGPGEAIREEPKVMCDYGLLCSVLPLVPNTQTNLWVFDHGDGTTKESGSACVQACIPGTRCPYDVQGTACPSGVACGGNSGWTSCRWVPPDERTIVP